MTRDEETYFMRLMQVADEETLRKHFTFVESKTNNDGSTLLRYDANYGRDTGYLTIKFIPEPRELQMAELNVGFPTLVGLNRSPLELRILVDHVLDVLYYPYQ